MAHDNDEKTNSVIRRNATWGYEIRTYKNVKQAIINQYLSNISLSRTSKIKKNRKLALRDPLDFDIKQNNAAR